MIKRRAFQHFLFRIFYAKRKKDKVLQKEGFIFVRSAIAGSE
jgi:hypothetical protein